MSTVPKRLLTPAEYLARERSAEYRSEFYRGEMFAMAGANRRHSLIGSNLLAALRPRLRACGCEIHGSDMRIKVSRTGLYTYPDASIACPPIEFEDDQEDVLINPKVIFEVLSKSTERRDRGWKFKQYRRIASLTDFLLVSQNRPYVEHYVRPPGGKFELSEAEGLDATISLAGLNCELSLRELYQDILLDSDDEMPPEADSAVPGE